jgi:hypothetical protein
MSMKAIMYVESFTCIIPAFIGLRYFGHLTNDLKAITLYTVLCVLFEIPGEYLAHKRMNNLFVLHVFTVVELVFLAYVYSFHIGNIINKKLLFGGTIAFVAFSIFNTIFLQPLDTFNSYARCVEILLVLFMAFCYIYALIVSNEQRQLRTLPMFWINTAVVIYFTASFFLYLVSNDMGLSSHFNKSLWFVHGLLLCGFYFAIAKAIWIQARQ